jgi:outer membrane lipoprotein SlyB
MKLNKLKVTLLGFAVVGALTNIQAAGYQEQVQYTTQMVCENHYTPIMEYKQVVVNDGPNYAGGIIGGALGGVLGHQIGGGKGKTAATIGGAVLGTMAGSQPTTHVDTYERPTGNYKVEQVCHQEQVRVSYQENTENRNYSNMNNQYNQNNNQQQKEYNRRNTQTQGTEGESFFDGAAPGM